MASQSSIASYTPEPQQPIPEIVEGDPFAALRESAPSPDKENTYTVILPVSTPDRIPNPETFPEWPGKEVKPGLGITDRELAISDLGNFYASWWLSPQTDRDWLPKKPPRCNLEKHLKGATYVIFNRCLRLTDSGKRQFWDSTTKVHEGTDYNRRTVSAVFDELETQHFTDLVASYDDPVRKKKNEADLRAVRDHATWAVLYPGVCNLIKTYGLRRGPEQIYFWAGFNYVLWLNHRFIIGPDGKRSLNPESHPTLEECRQLHAGRLVISARGKFVKAKAKTT